MSRGKRRAPLVWRGLAWLQLSVLHRRQPSQPSLSVGLLWAPRSVRVSANCSEKRVLCALRRQLSKALSFYAKSVKHTKPKSGAR